MKKEKNKGREVVHVLGEVDVEIGNGLATLIQTCIGDQPGKLDLVRPIESGKPIPPGGKIAVLRPCDDIEGHYECDVIDTGELASGNGPPQVASLSYRRGWDTVFGGKDSAN